MKKASWLAGVLAIAATPFLVQSANAAACTAQAGEPAILGAYNAATDCTVGVLQFTNFSFSGLASQNAANSIVLTSIAPVSSAGEFGFQLGYAGGTFPPGADLGWGFTVTAPEGFLIGDALGILTGSQNGNAFANLDETFFRHNTFTVIGTLHTDAADPDGTLVFFPGEQSIDVRKDQATFGTPGQGTAAVSLITNAFSLTAVPGPIVGAGLPGLIAACGGLIGLARRRRRKLA